MKKICGQRRNDYLDWSGLILLILCVYAKKVSAMISLSIASLSFSFLCLDSGAIYLTLLLLLVLRLEKDIDPSVAFGFSI